MQFSMSMSLDRFFPSRLPQPSTDSEERLKRADSSRSAAPGEHSAGLSRGLTTVDAIGGEPGRLRPNHALSGQSSGRWPSDDSCR